TITPNSSITSVAGTTPLCIGATATYTANGVVLGGGTGAWSSSNTAVATVTSSGLITAVSAGTANIIFTITGCNGPASKLQAITVNPNATITSVIGTTTLCIGATATYTSNGVVLGGGTGAWSSSNTSFATVNAATGLVTGISAGTANIIYTVTGCNGTPSSFQAITINEITIITSQPTSTTICVGSSVTTTVAANGANLTYQWQINTSGNNYANISGETNSALNFVSVTTLNAAKYKCIITGSCGTLTSNIITLTVNPVPTANISGTTVVCKDATVPNVTFTGSAGTAPYTFTYNINGGSNLTATTSSGSSITVPAQTATAGTFIYNLKSVKDASSTICSQAQTGTATITVNPLPTATISGTIAVCKDATAPNITFTGAAGTAPYTFIYKINSGSNLTITTTGLNSSVTVTAPTGTAGSFIYNLVSIKDATSSNCSQAQTGTATITVNPLPTASISGTTAVCKNAIPPNVTFTAAAGTAPYTFTYKINSGGTLTVTTTSGSSVTIPAPTTTAGTFIYTLVSVLDASSTNCSQAQTGTVTIIVNPLPTAGISGTIAVCKNVTAPNVIFTGAAGTAPYTFTYNINGGSNLTVTTISGSSVTVAAPTATAGTFIYNLVSVKDAISSNCSQAQTGTAIITVNPLPTASISGTTAVCKNAISPNVTFTGAAGTAPYTFTYKINSGGNLTVTTTSGSSVTVPAPTTTAGTFIYTLISVQDSSTTTCSQIQGGTATITINPLPTANISGTTTVCNNATVPNVTFTGAAGTAPYTFTYNVNGGSNLTVTTISGSSVTVAAPTATAGTFIYNLVSVKDDSLTICSQAQTGTATITVNPTPNAVATPASQTICSETQLLNVALSGSVGSSTFNWTRNNTTNVTGIAISGSGDISGYLTNNTPFDQTITFTITPISSGCTGTQITATVLIKAVPIEGVITFSNLSGGSSTATGCQLASGTLYLSGNTGTVARWEKSITAGTSWSTIAGSGGITEYNYSGLTETTKYRVVLTNGLNTCPVVYSASAEVIVIPNIKPSPVTATPSTICNGNSSVLFSVSGYATSQNLASGGAFSNSNPTGWLADGCGNCLNAGSSNTNPYPFQLSATNGGTYSGINYTSVGKFAIANGNLNSVLETPVFNTFGLLNPELKFDHAFNLLAGAWVKIELSFDGGFSYNTTLVEYNGASTRTPYTAFPPEPAINLSAYLNQANLRIRFNYHGVGASSWAIDNITIPEAPSTTIATQWVDNMGNVVSNTASTSVSPIKTTTYAVTSFLNGCTSFGPLGTVYVTVVVNQLPIITSSDTTICSEESTNISLSSTETGTTYIWSVVQTGVTGAVANSVGVLTNSITQNLKTTGTSSGTAIYTFTPTSKGCLGTVKTVKVTVNPRPTANLGTSQTICYGDSANFSISLTGKAPWTITYSDGVTPTTVTTSANPYVFTLTGLTANKTYTVTGLSDANCNPAKPIDLNGSAIVTVLDGTPGLWTGLVSSDWFDCHNWAGGLPSSTIDAQIPTNPSGSFGMPFINPSTSPYAAAYSNIASAQDIIIASGAAVNMAPSSVSDLYISRDWKNSGVFTPGIGTITFNGATSNQIQTINAGIKTKETFYNLTTNNSAVAKGISVADGFELTVLNNLTLTKGDLRLTGEAQLVQSGTGANPIGGAAKLLRDQQGQKNSFNYNYWSSPVSSNNIDYSIANVLKDGTSMTNTFTDVFNFSPSAISYVDGAFSADGALTSPITISNRWLFAFNSPLLADSLLNYYQWKAIGSAGSIKIGEGFTMKGTGGTAAVSVTQNYVFTGKPNSGTISLTLGKDQTYLVGNPYPSALDADQFIKDNLRDCSGCTNAENVFNGALYFWDHFGVTDNHFLAEYVGGYGTYSFIGGVVAKSDDPLIANSGTSGTRKPQRYIPVAQGFFVDAYVDDSVPAIGVQTTVNGGALIFKNTQRAFMKESIANSVFMKTTGASTTKDTDTRSKIRLGFDSSIGAHRQILVGADPNTTNQFDIGYDAPIFDLDGDDMCWVISNSQFVIQGVPNFDDTQIIPLHITIANAGLSTIKIDALENMPNTTKIYLYDDLTGIYHSLRGIDFKISLAIGEYSNRFSLRFADKTLKADDFTSPESILIYFTNNAKILNIKNNFTDATVNKVFLFNLLGQSITNWDLEEQKQNTIQIPIKNVPSGAYIVKVKTTKGVFSKKIIIR
ncbi:PKD-like domain-containing protein, partial [Flavobacterium urumqiense]